MFLLIIFILLSLFPTCWFCCSAVVYAKNCDCLLVAQAGQSRASSRHMYINFHYPVELNFACLIFYFAFVTADNLKQKNFFFVFFVVFVFFWHLFCHIKWLNKIKLCCSLIASRFWFLFLLLYNYLFASLYYSYIQVSSCSFTYNITFIRSRLAFTGCVLHLRCRFPFRYT